MRRSSQNRHPVGLAGVLVLAFVAATVMALLLLGAIEYGYRRIGIGEGALLTLLWLSLFGGLVTIPLVRLAGRARSGIDEIVIFGVRYRLPTLRRDTPTVLAVNVGGALIPTGLSAYLVIKDDIWWQALIGVLVVATVVHAVARAVADVGIVVTGLVSPVLAAGSALIVAPTATAAVAYAAGSLGTLIGGDLLNLRRLRDLGGGVISIGGARTFDGVFLSGIMAVVLVGIT
jgi:uncharacterized membrane protein